MDDSKPPEIAEYLAYHGGPFYDLQRRLGLLHEHSLKVGTRALVFVGLAWGVPFLLSIAEGHAFGTFAERPFLFDLAVWARFFIAVGLFIISEGQIEPQLRKALTNMVQAPILAPSSWRAAASAVVRSLRRRDMRRAEAVCLLLAIAMSLISLFNIDRSAASWAVRSTGTETSLTLAAWWCLLVSKPIFWFLFFRCIWREFVWARLLRRLAKLELRLVASHPDGKAGLAFIGQYPNAYVLFVFGFSCVVGSAIAHQLLTDKLPVTTYGYVMGAWLLVVLALFAYPLSAFTIPLLQLKSRTLLFAGAQATRFHRLSERKLLSSNVVAADPVETETQAEAADSSKHYDAAKKLKVVLISRSALIPVAAAALLPLFLAGITELPYKEVWAILKKLLLL